jgi:pimeloyl-ACP methyl ester carboxylesterase
MEQARQARLAASMNRSPPLRQQRGNDVTRRFSSAGGTIRDLLPDQKAESLVGLLHLLEPFGLPKVEREVEDLAAVIAEAGGTAAVYGHSSGAGLVLHGAARGLPIDKLVLHELPYAFDEDESQAAAEAAQLKTMPAENRRADAVAFFLSSTGMPPEIVAGLGQDPAMLANAPTLLYDPYEAMSARSRGGRTPAEQAATVTVPTLTIAGTASPQWMVDTSRQLAEALPHGRFTLLDDQGHIVPPEILTPVLAGFLAEETA